MCSPQGIFDMCVCKAFDEAVKACKCVRQYRTNLNELQTEMMSLQAHIETIKRKVGEANDRGEEVEKDVLDWQTKAGRLKSDVEQLVQQSTDNENVHCFTRSCPNIKCRYQLSKQAEGKIAKVKQLSQDSRFVEISHRKPRPGQLGFRSIENYVNLDSRTEVFDNIVDALKDPNINKIGVYGLGGVGKTALVKEVGKKLQHDGIFNEVVLATISSTIEDVKKIQSKLADSLDLKLDDMAEEKRRATDLWHKLDNGKKYLVILDDIWREVDLIDIGIPITGEKKGCKVLLTSRNEELLRNTMKVKRNFPIAELQDSEAWALFKEKVGNSIESRRELYPLAQEVCKKCKGLPVAINALGAALKGKEVHVWKTALDSLKRYMLTNIHGIDPSVWASLRVSYNMLQTPDAKSCFLFCCLFGEDAEIQIDDLTRYCVAKSLLPQNPRTFDEATNVVSTVVDTLKSSSLLLDGSNENVIKIHDVIRDVGIWIGREEEAFFIDHGALQWPRNPINRPAPYSAISLRSGKIKRLPDGLTYPQLHTLMIENDELSDLEVPDKFFSGMEQLTVLILTRLCMRLFPSSLANLTNFRMLYLNECKLGDIAILGNLKNNLEVLRLGGSSIKVLPEEIGQLTNLRLLDIQNCCELEVIPQGVIANLTSLEELYFPDEFDNWEALTDKQQDTSNSSNASLDELGRSLSSGQLTTLHIFVSNAMLLPKEGLKFENLKRFNIAVGSRVQYDEKDYSGARMLKLEQIPLRKELLPLVDKAEVLRLVKLEGLKKVLLDRLGENGLCNLKYLKVKSCFDDWECLVPSHGLHTSSSLDKLTVLIIGECNFKYLFSESTARELINLEELRVQSCEIMQEIIRFEGQNDEGELTSKMKFNKLKKLKLYDLPNLIRFSAKKEKMGTTVGSSYTGIQPLFNEMVIFPVLEGLTIEVVGNITDIWDKQSIAVLQEQGSFCQLMHVAVYNCKRLCYVFPSNMHRLFKNLATVSINSCGSMEGIIVGFEGEQDEDGLENGVTFSKLIYLDLWNLPNLISFCTKLGKEGTTERSSSTNNARPLFDKKVIFPVLERLTISAVGNMTEIWDKQSIAVLQEQGSFCQLRSVDVFNCKRLTYVFPSNMHSLFKNLTRVNIVSCESMEGIIVGFEGEQDEHGLENGVTFSKLSELRLRRLPKLISFCTKLGKEGTTGRSSSTNNAQPLFDKKVIFPVLERLTISAVDNITEIWDRQSIVVLQEQGSLCQLMDVTVSNCDRLTYGFPSNMHPLLKNLTSLRMEDCGSMEGIIVGFEGEQDEDGPENEVTFNKLSQLTLWNLANLISFSIKLDKAETTERSSSTNYARPLFNKKVALPALKSLRIWGLPNIIGIWDNQPLLGNMRILDIIDCSKMEFLVSKNAKNEEASNSEMIVFPRLSYIRLIRLENLKSLCGEGQLFLDDKDAFPVLKNRYLNRYPQLCKKGSSGREECGTSGKDEANSDHDNLNKAEDHFSHLD